MRRITQHKRIWIGTSRHGYRGGRRASVARDWTFWIPLFGAALFFVPLLGSAMASSFPVIEPRPVAMKAAMAAVTPLKLDLAPIRFEEAAPVNTLDIDGTAARSERAEAVQSAGPSIVMGNTEADIPEPEAWFEPNIAEPTVIESGWRSTVLRNAFSLLGTQYVWGGQQPGGFDCSGFIQYIMARSGIQLPRTAREMKASVLEIPESEMKPGDLIFFRSPDHVGLYIGDNRFVHASSGHRRVTIETLNREFYRRRYIGSGRVAE